MPVSVFDLFSIGVGPSSSHTVGPMRAAADFAARLGDESVASVRVDLYGSLASTGQGHGTLGAVAVGLMGERPEDIDPDEMAASLDALERTGTLTLAGGKTVPFRLGDIVQHPLTMLERHPNAMRIRATGADGAEVADETYYSIGGGFIARDGDDVAGDDAAGVAEAAIPVADAASLPYPFSGGAELMASCAAS
ncbi:MAG: L-serine ammonia-lyase, partial [Gordonia polyisoprenivorans]|nr:L-serine ammonia-lyase [Gordonia polyisoprenivorans]